MSHINITAEIIPGTSYTKVYDAWDFAGVPLSTIRLNGVQSEHTDVTLTPVHYNAELIQGRQDNKNVGVDKPFTIPLVLTGSDAHLYTLTNPILTTTITVTPKPITVSGITASNKTYDGSNLVNLNAAAVVYSGLISGDVLNSTHRGTFSDKNVGHRKTITITSSYAGDDVNNYTITDQTTTVANITHKSLVVSGIIANPRNIPYRNALPSTSPIQVGLDTTLVVYSGLVNGDVFNSTHTVGTVPNVIAEDIVVPITSSYSGDDVNNYSITDQLGVTVSVVGPMPTAVTLNLDATSGNPPSSVLGTGLVVGDTFTINIDVPSGGDGRMQFNPDRISGVEYTSVDYQISNNKIVVKGRITEAGFNANSIRFNLPSAGQTWDTATNVLVILFDS